MTESTGRWAPLLRRELAKGGDQGCPTKGGQTPPRVLEADNQTLCWDLVQENHVSLLVWEVNSKNELSVLDGLAENQCRVQSSVIVLLWEPPLSVLQWSFREAGATHIVSSIRRVHELVTIGRLFFSTWAVEEPTISEYVQARLPWGRAYDKSEQIGCPRWDELPASSRRKQRRPAKSDRDDDTFFK